MAEYRQWREENRTPLKDVIPLDTPYNIVMETSSLCNAKCVYCAHSKDLPGFFEGNMTMELFRHIMRDVHDFPHKVKLFEMFGFGEPLCNPNLAEMISIARKEKVVEKINFTTNGLLFNKENIDQILKAGVDTIRVSLQGLDSQTYEKVCGVKINFNRYINNLRYLYEHRGNCKIRMKIADVSIKDIPDGRKIFENIFGPIADSIFVERIIPIYDAVDYSDDVYKSAINGREDIQQNQFHKVCQRPFYRLRVGADGKVTAACCDTPNDIYLGDINEQSLLDIWNGQKRKALLKMQLEGRRFDVPECKNCILPNDITNEADVLDPWADDILRKF